MSTSPPSPSKTYTHQHLILGWLWITLFSLMGLGLEALHGFKVGLYLDVDYETRRLMWRLAHTHGVLLGVLHLAFSWTLQHIEVQRRGARLASSTLTASGVLIPLGFFGGGALLHGSDPGLGILLVPLGAVLLIGASVVIVRELWFKNKEDVAQRAEINTGGHS